MPHVTSTAPEDVVDIDARVAAAVSVYVETPAARVEAYNVASLETWPPQLLSDSLAVCMNLVVKATRASGGPLDRDDLLIEMPVRPGVSPTRIEVDAGDLKPSRGGRSSDGEHYQTEGREKPARVHI
jgi:hypothetical protein